MKHITLLTLLTLTTLLFAGNNDALKLKIEQLPMLKKIGVKVSKVMLVNDIYQIAGEVKGKNGGRLEGLVTKDFKNFIAGKAYNTQTGVELVMPFDIDIKLLKEVAAYKTGSGKDEYFVFTDPECPYCQRLEKKMHSLKKNVTVYTILFPLHFHKSAKSMSRYILSQKDDKARAKTMLEIANKSTKFKTAKYTGQQYKKYDAMIQKSLDVCSKIGITGTPTILNTQGKKVSPQMILK